MAPYEPCPHDQYARNCRECLAAEWLALEKVRQQLRPYMTDQDADTAARAVVRVVFVCQWCGYRPLGSSRPSRLTCPQCRGDFPWDTDDGGRL